MPSSVAWLDASAEDQRRMQEIVGLFGAPDSRDELGIGQIRDALSDTLFPGTSVLLSRARYLLFIPWCFQRAADSTRAGADARRERNERDLITTLRNARATDGLLGAQAGRSLKTLPSTVYWNTLRRWQVLRDPALSWQDALQAADGSVTGDEGRAPAFSAWTSGLPSAPFPFPAEAPGGFDLSRDEAEWLAGRVLTSCDGTLLAHLVERAPSPDSRAPWSDPAALSAESDLRVELEHARVFSMLVHGAALLYNLLLAERYASEGFDRLKDRTDHYRGALATWQAERDGTVDALERWSFDEFRGFIAERNTAVSAPTWSFLRKWIQLSAPGIDLAGSAEARDFVAHREREHKRSQSRLHNRSLLASWSGAAGSGAIVFRWNTVRRILLDIHEGLERPRV